MVEEAMSSSVIRVSWWNDLDNYRTLKSSLLAETDILVSCGRRSVSVLVVVVVVVVVMVTSSFRVCVCVCVRRPGQLFVDITVLPSASGVERDTLNAHQLL